MRNFFSNQKNISFSLIFFLSALLALLAGCGPGTPDTSASTGTAPTITVQLYDAKNAVATSVAPGASVTAKAVVLDDTGAPVAGIVVTFVVTDATLATVSQDTALTDANGLAQVTLSANGTGAVGATSISASASVDSTTGPVTATGQTSFAVVAGSGGGGPAPSPTLTLQLTNSGGADITAINSSIQGTAKVTIVDGSGAPVPGIIVTFSVANGALASISPATTALTNSNGVASVTLTAKAPGATSVTATATVSGTPLSGSLTFSVSTSAPSLTLSLSSTTVTTDNPGIVTANLRDGAGVVMPGVVVTFTVANTLFATVTATDTTDAFGNATATLTAVDTGTTTISASAPVPNFPPTNMVTAGPYNFSVVTTAPVASLSLSAIPTTVKSDNSNSTTVTVTALDSGNAAVTGVVVNLSADTGIVSTPTVTTGAGGKATFTFSSGTASKANRTATISASAGVTTAQLPVQIVGSTLTVNATGAAVPADGSSPVTMTFTAKDAGGSPISGAAVTLTKPAGVTLTPASGTTNASGQLVISVSGTAVASGTVTASAVGATASAPISVTLVGATFGISETILTPAAAPSPCGVEGLCVTTIGASTTVTTSNTSSITVGARIFSLGYIPAGATVSSITNSTTFEISVPATASGSVSAQLGILNPNVAAMQIGDELEVLVKAPAPIAKVTFATTVGNWVIGGMSSITVNVGAGTVCGPITTAANEACASLVTPTNAGLANIQVHDDDNPATNDSMTVSMTATTPYKITMQPSPSVIGKCVGTTCPFSTLIATVTDLNNQPVGNAQVAFSIVNPTGGGESVSPVVQGTAVTATSGLALGQAITTFTSGSLSSGASGIQVRAKVLGTSVVTNTSPSSNDATIVIGGTAGSIAFGQATSLGVTPDQTAYTLNMSVLVTDSNGNPAPSGTVVNLSVWPIAWSTGYDTPCAVDADSDPGVPFGPLSYFAGTFSNEDTNENLFLEPGEDGYRHYYYSGSPGVDATSPGTLDGLLTPTNSAAGSVPASVTTDDNGLASFVLTYPKTSAIWTVDRIRAKTLVQGSEAVSQVIFPLAALQTDVSPICKLSSPYNF